MTKEFSDKIKDLLYQMYDAQCKVNDEIFPGWLDKLDMENWEEAILVETAEALESAGYKWWKKQDIDEDNIKVELIDILHFKLSWLAYQTKYIFNQEISGFISGFGKQIKDTERKTKLLKDVGKIQSMFSLAKAMKAYGLDNIEDVFKTYMTKNVLNLFRTKNGYKEGTYIKNWNGVEDNVRAFELAEKIDTNNFFGNLYKELENYYRLYVKIEVKEDNDNDRTTTKSGKRKFNKKETRVD